MEAQDITARIETKTAKVQHSTGLTKLKASSVLATWWSSAQVCGDLLDVMLRLKKAVTSVLALIPPTGNVAGNAVVARVLVRAPAPAGVLWGA
jgi:hypothetical protein